MQRRCPVESREHVIGTGDQDIYISIISSRSSKLPLYFLHAFCEKVLHHWPSFDRVAYVAASEEEKLKHARYSVLLPTMMSYHVLHPAGTLATF